jgi:hypothetical protein
VAVAACAATVAVPGVSPAGRSIATRNMPTHSHTSFKKRQKELLRAEKQRDKAAKRLARKLAGRQTQADLDQRSDGEPQGERSE